MQVLEGIRGLDEVGERRSDNTAQVGSALTEKAGSFRQASGGEDARG